MLPIHQKAKKRTSRLLIVDDDDHFLECTKEYLLQKGFRVDTASSGVEAVVLAQNYPYDLIVLDVRMPDMDGMEVLKYLRSEIPAANVLMITGYQDVESATESLKLGAREYLSKPIDPEELVQRINATLRAHQSETHMKELYTQFLCHVLTELRTPVSLIQSGIEDMEHSSTQQRLRFHEMASSLERIDATLRDLVDLTMLESNQVDLLRLPTNLDELVPSVCARMRQRAGEKKIDLTVKVDDDVPTIETDPDKIEQVVTNLLSNAITYTPHGGNVIVHVSSLNSQQGKNEVPAYVQVSVSDTGIGIAEAELPFIFDKYKEVITGRQSQYKRTGLGLAISKLIVEAHDGQIRVTSRQGKGSTFSVVLPLTT